MICVLLSEPGDREKWGGGGAIPAIRIFSFSVTENKDGRSGNSVVVHLPVPEIWTQQKKSATAALYWLTK